MAARIGGLAAVAMMLAGQASAYEWFDNQHACVVENSEYMLVDGSSSGSWSNSPKSFFINITECTAFAKMHGLAYARSDDYGPNMTYEQLKLNGCFESTQMFQLYVIEVSDLSVGFQPASKFFFNDVPLASGGGSMKFDNDGRVSYSEYGETQSGQADAWFMLRANCTVLRR